MDQTQFGDNIEDLPVDKTTPPYHDAHLLMNLFDPKEPFLQFTDNLKILAISGILFLGLNLFLRKQINSYTKNEWMTTSFIVGFILIVSYVLKNYVFV